MDVNKMTRKQLEAVPQRKRFDRIIFCDSLVILPKHRLHSSGYRCMDFVACVDQEPFCRLGGCADSIRIDGIGGYGEWSASEGIPSYIPSKGWLMDCLRRSSLLRLMCGRNYMIKCDYSLSDISFYAVEWNDAAFLGQARIIETIIEQ